MVASIPELPLALRGADSACAEDQQKTLNLIIFDHICFCIHHTVVRCTCKIPHYFVDFSVELWTGINPLVAR